MNGFKTYLETHVGLLATGNELSSVWNRNDRDVVVVPSQEVLLSWNNVSNDDGGSKREDDVLVVRVQDESAVDLA